MDKLDKFNDIVLDLSSNWKYIYYFVAGLFVVATILSLGSGSKVATVIICWAILVAGAIVMNIVLREKKGRPENPETM